MARHAAYGLAALLLTLLAPAAARAESTDRQGYRVYRGLCWFCHSAEPLNRQYPPPLRRDKGPDLVLKYKSDEAAFTRWVQEPKSRPSTAYCKARALNARDLDALLQYLHNVNEPVPLPRAERRLREMQELELKRNSGTGHDKQGGTP